MATSRIPRPGRSERAEARSAFHRQRSRRGAAVDPRHRIDFIDLFAGIGGIRLAIEDAVHEAFGGSVGARCVFSSEWDPHCQQTYRYNFGETPHGDIHGVEFKEIPSAAILAGGFPCQPFSSIGRREGFGHETQGNLFFRIVEILRHHREVGRAVPAVLLENVEGLTTLRHDGRAVIDSVREELEGVGYSVDFQVLDAADFGVPQHRRRVFIVALDRQRFGKPPLIDWAFPRRRVADVGRFIQTGVDGYSISRHLQRVYIRKVDDGRPQTVTPSTKGPVKTLVSTYHKIQRLTGTFVADGPTGLRLLTREECRAIMGFPRTYEIPEWVSRTQAYRQFGNSVAPPVVRAVVHQLLKRIVDDAPDVLGDAERFSAAYRGRRSAA